jgi:hypothetical protein
MRRITLLAALGVVALLVVPPVAEAQTAQGFEAHFKNVQQRKAPPCPGGILDFCGSGTVSGFGPASYELQPSGLTPIPDSNCALVTAEATVTVADQSGSLTADATATVCFPGNSQGAPGSLKSFGNPFTATGSFVITGGTGVFAGATGGGTATLRGAGAHSSLDLAGTITL